MTRPTIEVADPYAVALYYEFKAQQASEIDVNFEEQSEEDEF
eukprot:CAMPEP_0184304362 /NCGR_PEP_ID=MMETSP1049-20130417/13901_1 /TAXON_ID=77928 /ORGANISM="Proteomonas sulcata, Strain CCMP704" /LENGTH=41 /DNA_ID= /DNA_START= /DNA_END= /DNA_ORIENTATION=